MKSVNPHLDFGGKCRDALAFYKGCLGGDVEMQMTYVDAKIDCPPQFANNVLHAVFRSDAIYFMASDGRADQPASVGNNVTLNLAFSDLAEQEASFNKLAEGGTVTLPLHDAFWGSRFGMLTDRFGIHWMLNAQK